MQEPPFIVGRPVIGEYFVDREEELRKLLALVEGVQKGASSNSALIGLRRTGKTSILENLEVRLGPTAQLVPVIVNCYGIAAKSRLAKVLVDKTIESYVRKTSDKAYLKRLTKTIGEAAKSAIDRVSEVKFTEFSLKLRDKTTEEDSLIEEALQYVESLAQEKKVFFVVMLDEFQDVIRWGDDTLKRIRTIVQSQKRVCYVLAGSATSVMRNLVYDHRSPFYRQLVEIPIKKLDKMTTNDFLKRRFAVAKMRAADPVIGKIATLSDGYPDYVQRLGLELYLSVGPGGSITEEQVDGAYEDIVVSLDGEFENYFSNFSPLEREILVALAIGKIQPSEVAREVRKPIFNISKTLTTLMNYGIIEKPMKGQYRITDPVFTDWLNRRFRPIGQT
ncbi:ATP-binding protein [Candidatus Bathyarchaeota archaeon]|nr:ATP-binding protein [Candidatus Bathyarchaeota archaeon]